VNRILVTGAEGFIGKKLCHFLNENNYEVITLDTKVSSQKFRHIDIDISDPGMTVILQETKPDVVVHLAAQIDVLTSFSEPEVDLQSNGQGTLNLIRASISSDCQNFVYIASGGATYDSNQLLPIKESGIESPVSPYGLTKLLGEGYVRVFSEKAGTNWTSLALSNCYGPILEHGRGVIFQFWKALSQGMKPVINGESVTRDMVHVDDVCQAILLAIQKPTNSRVNISSGKEVSLLELFEIIKKEMGSLVDPEIRGHNVGEVERSALDNTKAADLLDWTPTISLVQGIRNSLPNKDSFK
jgi:UDP-glucose 4-epimerase